MRLRQVCRQVVATVAASVLAATVVPAAAWAVGDDAPLISYGTSGTAPPGGWTRDGVAAPPSTSTGTSDGSYANNVFALSPMCVAPGQAELAVTVPGGVHGGSGALRVVTGAQDQQVAAPVLIAGTVDQVLTFSTDVTEGLTRYEVQRGVPPSGGSPTLLLSTTVSWYEIGHVVVAAPCPAISVSPNPLDRGTVPTDVTFSLTGFPPDREVVLRIEDSRFATVVPDQRGRATWVQEIRYPPPCGAYDVTAAVEEQPPTRPHTAATVLNVICPTLTANPSILPKTALPTSTVVSGAGWAARTDVTIAWDAGSMVTRSDGAGRISLQLPLAQRECGPVAVTATEQGLPAPSAATTMRAAAVSSAPQTASTVVTITCVDPPTLVVSPAVVGPGSVTQAVGTRLPAGAEVLLVWTDATARPMPGVTRAVVGPDGVVRSPVLVLPRSSTGPRQLVLLDATAPGSPALAATSALIVNNTVEPGRDRLVTRR